MLLLTRFSFSLFLVLSPQFLTASTCTAVIQLNRAPLPLAFPVVIVP